MGPHVCPWWGGYFIDNRLRRWLHNPEQILAPCVSLDMTVRPGESITVGDCEELW